MSGPRLDGSVSPLRKCLRRFGVVLRNHASCAVRVTTGMRKKDQNVSKVFCHLVEAGKPLNKGHFVQSTCKDKSGDVEHQVVLVGSTTMSAATLEADVIYSHLPIRWRTFPFLVALRAANPDRRIVHVEQEDTRRARKAKGAMLRLSAQALFDKVVTLDVRRIQSEEFALRAVASIPDFAQ